MKVLFFLKNNRNNASSRVRGFYIAEKLRSMNTPCDITSGLSRYTYALSNSDGYKVIFNHKCYLPPDIYVNKLFMSKQIKTIFDLDDAPFGVAISQFKETRAAKIMRESTAVTVGSHKLLEFASHCNKNSFLVPSCIHLPYYCPCTKTRDSKQITLGWIGNGAGYAKDLCSLSKPLSALGDKYKNIKFIIVGALKQKEIYRTFSAIKNIHTEFIDSIPWAKPSAVPIAIAMFDIGLYPLLDNKYNSYKCGFKALEYMAMKIPAAGSPVGETNYIIKDGINGFFARNDDEWIEKLSALIEDRNLRICMGNEGRKLVESAYTTNIAAKKIADIINGI